MIDANERLERLAVGRVFLSYSTVDRAVAGNVKAVLMVHGLSPFMAHDDLQVSEEWKVRILEELAACDIFVALLSKAFKASDWAPQELGYIVSRPTVAIVPLSVDGTMPFGFISHLQGRRVPTTGPDATVLIYPLVRKFPRLILPAMIRTAAKARSFRGAEALFEPLVPYFDLLTDDEANALAGAAVENGQIWSAGECRMTYLPALIAKKGDCIEPRTLKALEYQITNDRRYFEDEV